MSSLLKQCLQNLKKMVLNSKVNRTSAQALYFLPRPYSDNSKKVTEIQSGTILIQDGSSMQELPVIIRKVKDVLLFCENNVQNSEPNIRTKSELLDVERLRIVREEFKQCESMIEVFSLLSKCEKLTPTIAYGALERFYKMEQLTVRPGSEYMSFLDEPKNSVKFAIVEKMLDVIKDSNDVFILIETFMLVSLRDVRHRERYLNEILVRVAENKLSIGQACRVINFLGLNSQISLFAQSIDKFWVVFTDNEKEFDEKNLVATFQILPFLKDSRFILLKLAEKKMLTLWWKMSSQSVQDITDVLHKHKIQSRRVLSVVARWVNMNIHSLSEETLMELVAMLTSLDFNNNQIDKALERYIKAKSNKIKTDALIVTILNHCVKFRFRNAQILSGCSEYFIAKGDNLAPMFIKSLIFPFGWLCFNPGNGLKFWEVLETILNKHIARMNPADALDVMLACIYLEKYPLNFVNKIFSPEFLERVDSMPNSEPLRGKLKLLDTALTLECEGYGGPLLPKDRWAKSLWCDGRIKRVVNSIKTVLEELAGGVDCMSTSVLIPNIFSTDIYVVDIMLHPKGLKNSILKLGLQSDRNISVAILVNTPEHFCNPGDFLIGPQVMRMKHMRLLGMKVVSLKYDTLFKLKSHTGELKKYIISCLKSAQPAF